MSSLFSGLNISRNSLTAQTLVLNVVGHNVANANTEGYSRQTVMLTSLSGESTAGSLNRSDSDSLVGNGVEAASVFRSRSALYDQLYWSQNQEYNYYTEAEELFSQVESLFDEPSDDGLSELLDSFYNAWEDLSDNSDDLAAREALKSTAEELTARIQSLYTSLAGMRDDINSEIGTIPDRINEITREIASLNSSIEISESGGKMANDLRDKRDYLIDELSTYADVKAMEQEDNTYTVLIGTNVVVDHDASSDISAVTSNATLDQKPLTMLVGGDGTEYKPDSGTLGALMWFRDDIITELQDKLNTLAEAMVGSVNELHETGYGLDGETGLDFFDSSKTMAYNISLSSDIQDASNIAASVTGDAGDGSLALAISKLTDAETINGSFSVSEYYNALISHIGIMSSEAQSNQSNSQLLVSQIDTSRESVKGVSVDDELITMIQAQHIYQASSRVISTINTMLETLINI